VLQRCELQAFERLERVALFILITENENDTSFQFSACSGLLKSNILNMTRKSSLRYVGNIFHLSPSFGVP
ncbi:hypothetical protein, partial [Pantoea eucalypti]|uniref:hypothetical protein n=1 Tax=Pantoea eucalypti TaxID=470933 RepID=UPI001C63E6BC